MTVERILVAVDDSAAALHAARRAMELACLLPAPVLRFAHVLGDGELARRFSRLHADGSVRERRASAGASLLAHVLALAEAAGLTADTADLEGDPVALLLAEATTWRADLVVLGRSPRRGAGRSYVGDTARHVLEFSEVPVLLVPTGG